MIANYTKGIIRGSIVQLFNLYRWYFVNSRISPYRESGVQGEWRYNIKLVVWNSKYIALQIKHKAFSYLQGRVFDCCLFFWVVRTLHFWDVLFSKTSFRDLVRYANALAEVDRFKDQKRIETLIVRFSQGSIIWDSYYHLYQAFNLGVNLRKFYFWRGVLPFLICNWSFEQQPK